ncbi:MAG: hypothetical protein PWQ87_192 [Candidatus Woesearchaeota archaeon]|nr:hypothetical protein [Candidatus Woesearchaeota archaeon]
MNFKNGLLLSLVIIVMMPEALAQISSIDSINLSLNVSLSIMPQKSSSTRDVNLKLYYIPQNNSFQELSFTNFFPENAELKEDYINYYIRRMEPNETYFGYTASITRKRFLPEINHAIKYPAEITDEEALNYLEFDETFNFIEEAKSIIESEEDYLEVIFRISQWVIDNIEYELTNETEKVTKSASWVFMHRYGVCDEFSVLLASMLRSLGIPARVISGIAYPSSNISDDEEWETHSWVEVYIPDEGWLPVDPVFKEIFWLDSGHISIKEFSEDGEAFKYYWKGGSNALSSSSIDFSIKINSFNISNEPNISYSLSPARPSMAPSSFNALTIEIKNNEDSYIHQNLELSLPKDILLLGDKSFSILLKPNQSLNKTILFNLNIPNASSSIYTYTINLYSYDSIVASTDIKVSKFFPMYEEEQFENLSDFKKEQNVRLECIPESDEAIQNHHLLIRCFVHNEGNEPLQDLLCIEERCQFVNISSGESTSFDFYYMPYVAGVQRKAAILKGINKKEPLVFTVYPQPWMSLTTSFISSEEILGTSSILVEISPQTNSPAYNASVSFYLNGRLLEEWKISSISSKISNTMQIKNYLFLEKNKIDVVLRYSDLKGNPYSMRQDLDVKITERPFLNKLGASVLRVLFDFSQLAFNIQEFYLSLFE